MRTHGVLRIYITKFCREKADRKLGTDGRKYLISYAAEQWQLGNIAPGRAGSSYIEIPTMASSSDEVIWVTELDGRPQRLVLLDIGPRDRDKGDGFAKYVAEICGRFVGGVVGSLSS